MFQLSSRNYQSIDFRFHKWNIAKRNHDLNANEFEEFRLILIKGYIVSIFI